MSTPKVTKLKSSLITLVFVIKKIPTAKEVELLPYHLMGSHKYKKLGIAEGLAGVPAMDKAKARELHEQYFKNI